PCATTVTGWAASGLTAACFRSTWPLIRIPSISAITSSNIQNTKDLASLVCEDMAQFITPDMQELICGAFGVSVGLDNKLMDIFEEIIRMRRAGQRGVLATIVHTNGSIPSFESSRMLVCEDGGIVGTIGGGCVEADVWAAAREVLEREAP